MENLFGIIAFLFGVALLIFSFVNCALWLYFNVYKLFMNIIWQNKKFGQWLKMQTLPKNEQIWLGKGKRFDDLDIAFLSAVEDLRLKRQRKYYMKRRKDLLNQIKTEIDKNENKKIF